MNILKNKAIFFRIIVTFLVAVASVGTAVFANNVYHDHKEVRGAEVSIMSSSFGGGDGTNGNPYLISNKAHLNQLASDVSAGILYDNTHFELTNDIDFWDRTLEVKGSFGGIGVQGTFFSDSTLNHTYYEQYCFRGVFNGNGHTVSNFRINLPKSAIMASEYDFSETMGLGFFAGLQMGAIVSNLKLLNFDLVVNYEESNLLRFRWIAVGGIAGSAYADGSNMKDVRIQNCEVDGMSIIGGDFGDLYQYPDWTPHLYYSVGGIIGSGTGKIKTYIENCCVKNCNFDSTSTWAPVEGESFLIGTFAGALQYDKYYNTTDGEGNPLYNSSIANSIAHNNSGFEYYGDNKNYPNSVIACGQVNSNATNVYCDATHDYTLSSISEKGGENENSIWYSATDYNEGIPVLRVFVDWQKITIKGIGANVGLAGEQKGSQATIEVPSDIDPDKTFSSINANITIYARDIESASALCHGKFVQWTCKSPTLYEVEWEPLTRTLWLADLDSRVNVVADANNYEVACGTKIYFEFGDAYLKVDENFKRSYYRTLRVYYLTEGVETTLAVYTAINGNVIMEQQEMFIIDFANASDIHTKLLPAKNGFEIHDDVSIVIKIEPMTYSGGII